MVTINSAESNRASLRYIPEATWGTTPALGRTREMRITSSSLVSNKETQTSDEIRADRMVPNIIEVSAMASGGYEAEFSAFTHDDMFQGFLLGAWSKPMTGFQVKGASVTITDIDEITITGADWRDWLTVGHWLKLEGFLVSGNNTYVSIASLAFTGGNTVITTNETTLTAASGSAFTKIVDANDVILVSTGTAISSGNTINGGGSNSFSGDVLKVGQKIWMDGLGKETGTVVVTTTNPTEGATITVSDGVQTVVFEVRTNAALVASGNVHVALSGTEATQAASLTAAIQAQFAQENVRVSATVSTATVTLTNHRLTGGSIATSDATAFTVTNFSGGSTAKGGFLTIASLPNDDTIVVQETLSTDANSGSLPVVIKGSHLRNPGTIADITKQSFSIETGFTDVNKYFLMTGLRPGSFEMNVEAGELVTLGFEFMGRATTTASSTTLGNAASYDVLGTTGTEVLNATANVGAVKKDGTVLSTAVMSIEMSGDAGLREQPAVGEKFPAGIGYGRFTLEGTITAYFQDFDFYNDFINHTTVSISYDFEDVDHNAYIFSIPSVKILSDPISPGGIDEDIMEELEFQAQRDPSLNTMFMIDRFSSTYPATA